MGGEPVSHHGTETVYRSGESHFFSDSLRDDAHLFSFLLLAEFCLAIPLPLSGRVGDGNHSGRGHRLLPAGSSAVCERISAWDGSRFRSSGQSSSFSEKESHPFCRLPSGTVGEH